MANDHSAAPGELCGALSGNRPREWYGCMRLKGHIEAHVNASGYQWPNTETFKSAAPGETAETLTQRAELVAAHMDREMPHLMDACISANLWPHFVREQQAEIDRLSRELMQAREDAAMWQEHRMKLVGELTQAREERDIAREAAQSLSASHANVVVAIAAEREAVAAKEAAEAENIRLREALKQIAVAP